MKSYGPRFYDVEEGGGVRSSHETVFASRPPAMVHAAAVLGSPPRSSAATRMYPPMVKKFITFVSNFQKNQNVNIVAFHEISILPSVHKK